MGRKPDMACLIPPDVAMFGNAYAIKWQNNANAYRTYSNWWQLFYTAATTCFKWEGMPAEVDTRFFEKILFLSGSAALTKRAPEADKLPLWVVTRFSQQGQPDIYNNPNTIRMVAPNGMQWVRHLNTWVSKRGNQHGTSTKLMSADAVACWDNLQRLPLYNAIDVICTRLSEFDLTIDQNVRAHRVPYIINVPEESKRNAEAMFNKVNAGEPAIYLSPLSSSVVNMQVFNSGIDYNVDRLLNDQLKLVSQAYTLLGIDNNAAAEKKERVQTAETLANNEQFMVQRESRYQARLRFADQARELFGLELEPMWAVPHTPMVGEELNYGSQENSQFKPSLGTSLFERESGAGSEAASVDVL